MVERGIRKNNITSMININPRRVYVFHSEACLYRVGDKLYFCKVIADQPVKLENVFATEIVSEYKMFLEIKYHGVPNYSDLINFLS